VDGHRKARIFGDVRICFIEAVPADAGKACPYRHVSQHQGIIGCRQGGPQATSAASLPLTALNVPGSQPALVTVFPRFLVSVNTCLPPEGLVAAITIARKNSSASRFLARCSNCAASTTPLSTASGSTVSMIPFKSLASTRPVDHVSYCQARRSSPALISRRLC